MDQNVHKYKYNFSIEDRFKSISRKIDNSYNTVQILDSKVSTTQILLQKLKHALSHKSLSIDNNKFTSCSMNFYE